MQLTDPRKMGPLASVPKATWGQAEPHFAQEAPPPSSPASYKRAISGHVSLADVALLFAQLFLSPEIPVHLSPYFTLSSFWPLRKEDPYAYLVEKTAKTPKLTGPESSRQRDRIRFKCLDADALLISGIVEFQLF